MAKYFDILVYFGLFVFFMLSDLVLYYAYGRHHSLVPFVIFSGCMLVVLGICGMAAYETFKHRHDKEPW